MWVLYEELLGVPEVSSTDSIPTGFCSQKLWGLIFLVLEPWTGGPGVGLGFLSPEISSQIFSHHTWVRDQPVLSLHPSY